MENTKLILLFFVALSGFTHEVLLQYQPQLNLLAGPSGLRLDASGDLDLEVDNMIEELGLEYDETLPPPLHHGSWAGNPWHRSEEGERNPESSGLGEAVCCLPPEFESKLSVSALVAKRWRTRLVSADLSVAVNNATQKVAVNATIWLNAFLRHTIRSVFDVENVYLFSIYLFFCFLFILYGIN